MLRRSGLGSSALLLHGTQLRLEFSHPVGGSSQRGAVGRQLCRLAVCNTLSRQAGSLAALILAHRTGRLRSRLRRTGVGCRRLRPGSSSLSLGVLTPRTPLRRRGLSARSPGSGLAGAALRLGCRSLQAVLCLGPLRAQGLAHTLPLPLHSQSQRCARLGRLLAHAGLVHAAWHKRGGQLRVMGIGQALQADVCLLLQRHQPLRRRLCRRGRLLAHTSQLCLKRRPLSVKGGDAVSLHCSPGGSLLVHSCSPGRPLVVNRRLLLRTGGAQLLHQALIAQSHCLRRSLHPVAGVPLRR